MKSQNKGPLTNSITNSNFITTVYPDALTFPKRRTYRGNNYIPNISNYYKQSENNSKKIRSLNKTFEKLAANTEEKFRNANMTHYTPNISNYYAQSENNSKKIKSLNKTFEKLAANTEEKFRFLNIKQKLGNEIKQRKIDENTRKLQDNIKNTQMRQKLKDEMKQIEHNEIKRKKRRTKKQINNEIRQEKEERNQMEREQREEQEEREKREGKLNEYANYPTMKHFQKLHGKIPTSENLIKFMMKKTNNEITKNLKKKYVNSGQIGTLANPHGNKKNGDNEDNGDNNNHNAKARRDNAKARRDNAIAKLQYNQIKIKKPLYNPSENIFNKTNKKRTKNTPIENTRRRVNL